MIIINNFFYFNNDKFFKFQKYGFYLENIEYKLYTYYNINNHHTIYQSMWYF
jgi:hypothetical protein